MAESCAEEFLREIKEFSKSAAMFHRDGDQEQLTYTNVIIFKNVIIKFVIIKHSVVLPLNVQRAVRSCTLYLHSSKVKELSPCID